ncbi:MAG: ABC transporter ATP-binding protein [Chloroflexi bacterium CFX2]|nr:ABC transporter ATP-binding protein [Chloroflexi bacterium CFX2]
MGFFAGLNDEKYDRQYKDSELVRRMVNYFNTQTSRLLFASIIIILLAIVGAALPVIVSRMVDAMQEEPTVIEITWVGAALVGVAFGLWGLNWLRRGLIVRAVGDVVLDMRSRAFRAAAEHDLSFYDQLLVVIVTDVVAQAIQAILIAIVLFRTEVRLSLLLISFLPFIFFVASGFRAMARRVTKRGMKAMSDVNAAIKETISGISIAKNFRQEESIFKSFDESNQQSYGVNVQRGFVLSLVFPTLNALGGIFVGILVYVGGHNAAAGAISIGAWYLFIMSLDQFFFPVLNLTSFWAQIQSGLSAAERVFALIDADPNVIQIEKGDVPRLHGEINFDHIHFRYSDKEPVLTDFNLFIQPGETLALVGHTGAGKSSIAKLIARFYEFQQGRLLIDGRDIRTFDLTQYRRQLGIVSQVPFLFSGTIADNIRYAAPGAPEGEMLRLAKRIGDGEWLDALPNGLHTEVGERGNRLSMGQRQLVALMRVLVQNPAIFILDEATASIDPFTEWQIQQALNLILKNSTSILIAHRLSTVKAADRIVVMRKGTIIEEGNHQGLLDQNGHYAELYNTYFRHQSLAYVEQVKEMVGK